MMGMFDKNAENECQATRKDKARLVASFCAGRKRWEWLSLLGNYAWWCLQ